MHLNAHKNDSPLEPAGPGKDGTKVILASCSSSHITYTSSWHTEDNFVFWSLVIVNLKSKGYVQDGSPRGIKPTLVVTFINISLPDSAFSQGLLIV